MKCDREGCNNDATSAMGIAFYPPRAVMEFYKTDKWLTRIIIGLHTCDAHFPTDPFELMSRSQLQSIAKVCETSSGTVVDMDATKTVKVAFDDPDYVALIGEDRDANRT